MEDLVKTIVKTIHVLIVDDHKMVRFGIRNMLYSNYDKYRFEISQAEEGSAALDLIFERDFDIIFMDYQLPGISGPDVVRRALTKKPYLKFLAISNYDEPSFVTEMIRAGAKGYVLKNIGTDELILATEKILSGKNYYANDIAHQMINLNVNSGFLEEELKKESISRREMQILIMIASEMTNEQIADRLKIAKRTVDSHRQNLLNKLNVRNTAGLINYAHRHKLI